LWQFNALLLSIGAHDQIAREKTKDYNMKTPIPFITLLSFFIFSHQSTAQPVIDLPVFASGFTQPVDIAHAGDDRLFIVEKAGLIRIIGADGQTLPSPFLDIRDRVNSSASERGLLGLAFHPNYTENGFFFVNYTDNNGNTRIARFSVSGNGPNQADPGTELLLLEIDQPFSNHNAGDLAFGPEGFLYIGTGDGGSGGDPRENGQDRLELLGKMLRIDVDNGNPYAIPDSNPFAFTDGTLDEIWALGLRNPWRYSFDRQTGDLWIADVGQSEREEINRQPAGAGGGQNYGWDCYEGNLQFELTADCPASDQLTFPLHTYSHDEGDCSVTGGFVYRGSNFPNLQGVYLYADFCSGRIWGLLPAIQGGYVNELLINFENNDIVSFGEDQNGELYVAGIQTGNIYRLIDQCASLQAPDITFSDDVLSVPDTFDTYQWFLNSEPISGATAPTYAPTESGPYTVEVEDERGCTVLSEPFSITSLAETIGIRWWQVTPNPFSNRIRLEVEVTEPAVFQVKIYDAGGRLVMEDRLERGSNWNRLYQLEELKSGLYFFSLERGKLQVVQKLLKTE